MSHLIQPIDIEGTKYCVKHGTPVWRTISILTGDIALQAGEDDDVWNSAGDGVNGGGLIRFATCCLWKATVRFLIESDVAIYEGSIFLNGDYVDGLPSGATGGSHDFVIDLNALGLMGRPCGNRWDITANYEDGSGIADIAVAIVDVTYGPPV